jgi:putative transposase
MARIPRSALPDGIYHVTSRGVAQSAIFRSDDDRVFFLRLFASVVDRWQWEVHAFCLMGNHYHLVLETSQPHLSGGMQSLNWRYAEAFNDTYLRSGHLFGARFASYVIADEDYLANACTYVVHNPVRAGLCERGADWPWAASRYPIEP